MHVLVTGGNGFIGSAVCRLLIAAGWSVTNLDKLTYAATESALADAAVSDRYRFIRGDIADPAIVGEAFRQSNPDAVINLAAETHVDRSITGPEAFLTTNVVGTFVMLQAALVYRDALPPERRQRFRFLHVSTDEVFGSLGAQGRFSETSRYDPRSPYAATKAASDHLVSAWGSTYGLPVLISNCSNNYGPFQFPEKLIPLTILNAMHGKPIPVYGDGLQVRDWLFVDDHARALKSILERGAAGKTYNVGGSAERTNLAVVQAICDLVAELQGKPSLRYLITSVLDRPGHDRRYAIDAAKIEAELGWTPSIAFEEGLAATITWYQGNKDWWRPLQNRYDGARLGDYRA